MRVTIEHADGWRSFIYYPAGTDVERACELSDAHLAALCVQGAEVVAVDDDDHAETPAR